EKVRPIMLHRAIYGSLERFIGILIEHFGGAFPLWLAPVQVILLPVQQEMHLDYTKKIAEQLANAGLRVQIDDSGEKLGYRLRLAQIQKVPVTLVIGDKEVAATSVMARRYGSEQQSSFGIDELIAGLRIEASSRSLHPIKIK
ncbi:MAG TPA: threonine--tRNA ligase, partial [Firmicutes bacterium]|nr:threonine--tRNA ligase [Bacillota bacterium]